LSQQRFWKISNKMFKHLTLFEEVTGGESRFRFNIIFSGVQVHAFRVGLYTAIMG